MVARMCALLRRGLQCRELERRGRPPGCVRLPPVEGPAFGPLRGARRHRLRGSRPSTAPRRQTSFAAWSGARTARGPPGLPQDIVDLDDNVEITARAAAPEVKTSIRSRRRRIVHLPTGVAVVDASAPRRRTSATMIDQAGRAHRRRAAGHALADARGEASRRLRRVGALLRAPPRRGRTTSGRRALACSTASSGVRGRGSGAAAASGGNWRCCLQSRAQLRHRPRSSRLCRRSRPSAVAHATTYALLEERRARAPVQVGHGPTPRGLREQAAASARA